MMTRVGRVAVRIFVAMLVCLAALWVTARIYGGYEAHRAFALLNDAQKIKIGDSEASILLLVKRYKGHQFMPYTAAELDPNNFSDLWTYEYRRRNAPHSGYRLAIVSWGFGTDPMMDTGFGARLALWLSQRLYTAPVILRRILGMSYLDAGTQISVRDGRVSAVRTYLDVERHFPEESIWRGSSLRALISSWELAEEMPCQDKQGLSYAVTGSENSVEYIRNYLTPKASGEQFEAAQTWNTACVTSFRGCEGVNQVLPGAFDYLKKHPEAVSSSSCP